MKFLSQRAALELLRDEAEKALSLKKHRGAPMLGVTSSLLGCPSTALRFVLHVAKEGLESGEPS